VEKKVILKTYLLKGLGMGKIRYVFSITFFSTVL
jgi:hypothetical protein